MAVSLLAAGHTTLSRSFRFHRPRGLMCDTGRTGDVEVHLGDVVGVAGRPAKSRRGEPSLAVDELTILARNRSLNFATANHLYV